MFLDSILKLESSPERLDVMIKHLTKNNCNLITPVEVFKLVLGGKLKRFPPDSWTEPDAVENGVEILRFLFESILQWSPKDIKKNYSRKLFIDYKLEGLFKIVFNSSPFQALNALYPNQFREWELHYAPNKFWTEETGIQATRWLVEEKLKWTENDIKEKLMKQVFCDNELGGMLRILYGNSVWRAVNQSYPSKFKEWELQTTHNNFWNETTGIKATKWLIEEKLKWTETDIKEKITYKIFCNNGLGGMLFGVYHGSPWQAINAAYPNQFKEWEMPMAPLKFWNEETGIRAVKWVIEEELKWTDYEIKKYLRIQTFSEYGFATMIYKLFNNDLYRILNTAYPGRFQRSDLISGGPKIIPKPQPDRLPASKENKKCYSKN